MTWKPLKKTDGRGENWKTPNYENWIKVFPSSRGWGLEWRVKSVLQRRNFRPEVVDGSIQIRQSQFRCFQGEPALFSAVAVKNTSSFSAFFSLFQSKKRSTRCAAESTNQFKCLSCCWVGCNWTKVTLHLEILKWCFCWSVLVGNFLHVINLLLSAVSSKQVVKSVKHTGYFSYSKHFQSYWRYSFSFPA